MLIIMLPPGAATLVAQAPVPQAARVLAANGSAARDATEVHLLVGRSTVLDLPAAITRVSLASPDIADAMVTTAQQVLVHGKAPGTISMFLWERSGAIRQYEVVVRRDLSQLEAQMRQLFPGEPIVVSGNGTDLVLSGTVSGKHVVDRAAAVAAGFVEKPDNVVNLLQQREGVASNQVLLRVRFAEVSRSALTELGLSLFSDGHENVFGRSSTQQFSAPFFSEPDAILGQSLVFSDYLNLFLFDAKNQLGAVVRALNNRGLFQTLAEPNLIAQNGKEATFLAGGEFPYPVVQGSAGGQSVTIQFKEFGVRLNFTPTILGGELINLKVRPEVSSLDFANGVSIQGFRVPALSTRRAETELELRDGQTFAIAGLLNSSVASALQKVPGIGDIPILGLLFKSKSARKEQTELVVMITPQILRAGSNGVTPRLPSFSEPFLGPSPRVLPEPAPWAPQTAAPAASGPGRVAASPFIPSTPAPVEPGPTLTREEREAMERARREELKREEAEFRARQEEERRLAKAREEEEKRLAKAREEEEKRLAREHEEEERRLAAERAEEEKRLAKAREEEEKLLAKVREEEAKLRREEEKLQRKEDERLAKERAEEEKRAAELKEREEKIARERGRKEAEAALRAGEERRKQQEEEEKRGRALAAAEARLREARAAYEAEVGRSGGE